MEQFLIERIQNYTLDRKVLSIDSNDRDKSRWPNSNEFEISTPQVYNNIESIRLLSIQIPNQLYNISEHLQNNKMIIKKASTTYTITLKDGFYNNTELCQSIETDVNKNSTIISDLSVSYNSVSQKPHFISQTSDFSLIFQDSTITYNNSSCVKNIYDQHSNWGLGYILGFNNKNYVQTNTQSNANDPDLYFYHNNTQLALANSKVIIPPNKLELNQNQFIYLELDKYNSCDEIKPYINNTLYNTNTGLVNSFFAKIPIRFSNFNQTLSFKDDIDSLSFYQPVIEKLGKLKIKFRYHNGLLVDLQNNNISFNLEINQIRNELKNYDVRKPIKY